MAGSLTPVLVDTSAWIAGLRGSLPEVVSLLRQLLADDLAVTCGPVLFEIRRGLRPSERKRILSLFEAMGRLPFREKDWELAGDLDASLRRQGRSLPAADVLIAHLCLKHKVALLTLDDHFAAVPGLRLVPLAKPAG
jgi:predicted nucleic acid-binding protein